MSATKTFYDTWTKQMDDGFLSTGFTEVQAEWYCVRAVVMEYEENKHGTPYAGHACIPENRHLRWGCHWAVKPQ